MKTRAEANRETLRDRFEGRPAIYIEAGVVCVRVLNVSC